MDVARLRALTHDWLRPLNNCHIRVEMDVARLRALTHPADSIVGQLIYVEMDVARLRALTQPVSSFSLLSSL